MKATTTLISELSVLGLSIGVQGRLFPRQGYTPAPPCVASCLNDITSSPSSCDVDDIICRCLDDAVIDAAWTCIEAACTDPSLIEQAIQAGGDYCENGAMSQVATETDSGALASSLTHHLVLHNYSSVLASLEADTSLFPDASTLDSASASVTGAAPIPTGPSSARITASGTDTPTAIRPTGTASNSNALPSSGGGPASSAAASSVTVGGGNNATAGGGGGAGGAAFRNEGGLGVVLGGVLVGVMGALGAELV